MATVRRTTVLIAAIAAHGCGYASGVAPQEDAPPAGARRVASAPGDGRPRASRIVPLDDSLRGTHWFVPVIFEDGRATRAEVAEWTSVIRRGEGLMAIDPDADGRENLLLAEVVDARGTTGNRSFLAFVAGPDGYSYAGGTGNFARAFGFPSGNSYVLDYGVCGPQMGFGLHAISRSRLVSVGSVVLDANCDEGEGTPEDVRLRDRLREGDRSEAELRAVFTSVQAEPGLDPPSSD